jgi:hypothetical protein
MLSVLHLYVAALTRIQTLLRAGSSAAGISAILRQADSSNMRAVLKEIKLKNWENIIADLNINETALLLKTVRRISYEYQFILEVTKRTPTCITVYTECYI